MGPTLFAREVRRDRRQYGAGSLGLLGKSTLPTSTTVTRAMNHDYGRTAGLGLTFGGTIVVMGAAGVLVSVLLLHIEATSSAATTTAYFLTV